MRLITTTFFAVAVSALMTTASFAAGDAVKGAKVFKKCKSCHVADSDKNKVGPSLQGVIGRDVAAVESYASSKKYSKALKEWGAGKVWDEALIAEFITKPKSVVKGTKMAFAGLKKEQDRLDVIAYLAAQ